MKKTIFFTVLTIICLTIPPVVFAETVLINPTEMTSPGVGGKLAIKVMVEGAKGLFGFEFDLSYSPESPKFVNAEEGDFLQSAGQTFSVPAIVYGKKPKDGGVGTIRMGVSRLGGAGVDGNGVLAKVEFEVIKEAVAPILLEFQKFSLFDAQANKKAPAKISGSKIMPRQKPTKITLVASDAKLVADGKSTTTLTAKVEDANGVPVSFEEVKITATLGTVGDVVNNGDGTYSAIYTSATLVGTVSLTATATKANILSDIKNILLVPGPVAKVTVKTDKLELSADVHSTASITVSLADASGNPVPGEKVDITASTGTVGAVTDLTDGTYSATYTASKEVGKAKITATAAKVSGTAEITLTKPKFPPYDVNQDGIVDILDLVFIGQHFGEKIPKPIEPNPDVNGDGVVDILDLVSVGQHFGEKTAPAAPVIVKRDLQRLPMPTPTQRTVLQSLYEKIRDYPDTDASVVAVKQLLAALLKQALPKKTRLAQNYPNPFNPETWIPFQLSQESSVVLMIYDVKGQLVRELNLGKLAASVYSDKSKAAYWDGRNARGEKVASGVYFYTIQAGNFTSTRKMVLMK